MRAYRIASDGLIYKYGSNELYTGKIIDTLNVIVEFEVVDGVKHGGFVTYYSNGSIEKIGWIRKNKNVGEWKYYYQSGNLECKGYFYNDTPEGYWKWFYSNGKLKGKGYYSNGKQEGEWISFDMQGKVIDHLYYRNGNVIFNYLKSV